MAIPYHLLGLLLLLDVSAFLLEKVASSKAGAMTGGEGAGRFYMSLLTHPWAWAALALGPIQLWTWTRILSTVDISIAYPMSSLNYPLTLLGAVVILGERLTWPIWVGSILIMCGGIILGPMGHAPRNNAAAEKHA